ncbi:hypothetical protein NIES21_59380 (plasmid) [Anabaenopsis circularis NIES-21]|uniref:Uncharacterized protein n=1 Tax=Anabaenopsis circularis NIES-21 TaxID=1085406 RepID=A0A1Z4GRV0_9CYAN|nr:hypothetical protein NIES21_59380 [Anabaenopsis circularis NIES-21]
MKPIKKPEFRALKKSVASQPVTEEVLTVEPAIPVETVEQQQPDAELETPAPQYIPPDAPAQDYSILQSVGNSG